MELRKLAKFVILLFFTLGLGTFQATATGLGDVGGKVIQDTDRDPINVEFFEGGGGGGKAIDDTEKTR